MIDSQFDNLINLTLDEAVGTETVVELLFQLRLLQSSNSPERRRFWQRWYLNHAKKFKVIRSFTTFSEPLKLSPSLVRTQTNNVLALGVLRPDDHRLIEYPTQMLAFLTIQGIEEVNVRTLQSNH
jgi:hypothetical protein